MYKTIQPPCGRRKCIPLWWLAPPPFPRKRGHYKAPLCCELLMKGLLFRALFFPLNRGKSGAARIGGGERSEPVSRIVFMPYDTESKSRNVLASPLGEEGHEVAKGCTRVRMNMILDVDVTAERRHYNTHRPLKGKRLTTFCASLRSGGRRLAVRTAMEHPIGALPRTPFPASRDFPSRGNEKIGGTGYCVTYDTKSQSRNADFILIALRAIPQPSA